MHKHGIGVVDKKSGHRLNLWPAFLLPVLLYLLVQAVFSGLAYVDQYHLNARLDRWYGGQSRPSLREWISMKKLALASLQRNKSNADFANSTGRLYDYRSTHMTSNGKKKRAYEHKAISYYKQVIRLRPAWPYGWLNLASSKARLGEIDPEFKHALLQLLRQGPWEKNTLPPLLQLGLFAWPYLKSANRQLFLDYFIVAGKSRKEDVYKALSKSGQLKLYCSIIAHKGDNVSFCL